jgi:putative FmdB family regulatory protein
VPLYEYRRPDGSTFEVLQSMQDEPLTTDPETGVAVERVLSAPYVHVKGRIRERQRRLLDRSAEQGANEHDERFKAERPHHFKKKDGDS